jgi:hypothetical protein
MAPRKERDESKPVVDASEVDQGGRPTKYDEAFAAQAKVLCEKGFTDIELANFFKVHVATIYRWLAKYPEFCEAIKSGKDASDERVERSLYHKAIGYTYESEKIFQFQGEVVRAKSVEHVPPDTTAAIFWLKNRRKEQWRDKHEIDQNINVSIEGMNAEELRNYVQREIADLGLGDETAKASGRTRVSH